TRDRPPGRSGRGGWARREPDHCGYVPAARVHAWRWGPDGVGVMKRLLLLGVSLLAGLLLLVPAGASAAGTGTLAGCLAQQHVCVSGAGHALLSRSQEAAGGLADCAGWRR